MIWTLADIRGRIVRDLELQREDRFKDINFTDFINEGIEDAVEIINNLVGANYYRTKMTITPNAEGRYPLPDNINTNKIVCVVHTYAKIPQLIGHQVYEDRDGWYLEYNTDISKNELVVKNELTENFEIHYLAEPKILVQDTDITDLPNSNCVYYVIAYVKYNFAVLEQSSEAENFEKIMKQKETKMINSLTPQTKLDKTIPLDESILDDQDLAGRYYLPFRRVLRGRDGT